MQDMSETALTDGAPARDAAPDFTPRPLPEWDTVARDVSIARVWLDRVAADSKDPRSADAKRLVAGDGQTGMTRLEQIARLAHRSAGQPLDVPFEEVAAGYDDMWMLVYDFSEDSGDHESPLYFLEPSSLLDVLEVATSWHGLANRPVCGMSTRQLAQLARVDEKTVEQQLDQDGICFQPYGVSLREMEEMTPAERLFWHGQDFVFESRNFVTWLSKFPGFTPPRADMAAEPAA